MWKASSLEKRCFPANQKRAELNDKYSCSESELIQWKMKMMARMPMRLSQNLRGQSTPTPAKSAQQAVHHFAWFVCQSNRMLTETVTFESAFAVAALRAQTRRS